MSEDRLDYTKMDQPPSMILPSHQGLGGDKMKELVRQSHRVVDLEPVSEFDPMLSKSIVSSSPIELERNLDSKSYRQSLNTSGMMLNSHHKRKLSPSNSIWQKSVRSRKLPHQQSLEFPIDCHSHVTKIIVRYIAYSIHVTLASAV